MSQAGQTTADVSPETIDYRIVEAVADAKGVEPLDLNERLYDIVDPDAIAKLFVGGARSGAPVQGEISFVLDDCVVTVAHDMTVAVEAPAPVAPEVAAD
jgi:hypothetical protein